MKLRTNLITLDGVGVQVVTEDGWRNTFVVNGTPWNGFKNMTDFKDVLLDSFLLEGYQNADELVEVFAPVIISNLEKI